VKPLKTYIAAKIHGVTVTACHLTYHGSQTLPKSLLDATGIEPYEQCHVVNLRNGKRWITYVLSGDEGICTLNGAAAHNGDPGDELIVMVYRQGEAFPGATVAFCAHDNRLRETLRYEP
jgi:aspartate 1-decarboxylase